MKSWPLILFLTSSALASSPLVPDPKLTPGDVLTSDPKVICVSGYTKTVRDVPTALKNQVYKNYGITSRQPKAFEIDHLISLELGGSNSIRNLWPESYLTKPLNAHVKDSLENKLHALACKGTITFQEAQKAIASDWVTAYNKYIGPLEAAATPLTPSTPTTPVSAGLAPSADGECPSSDPLKGSSTKKYHHPGGRYYANTKAQICFATEADAENAGYVKAKGQ